MRKQARGKLGFVLVESPNDAIRLHTLSVLAVALCSNQVTDAQAKKATKSAQEFGKGTISLMLDNYEAGDAVMKQPLPSSPALERCDWCYFLRV